MELYYTVKLLNGKRSERDSKDFNRFSTFDSLSNDGTLWVWGDNMFGQLGTGRELTISDPIQVGI